MTQTSKQSRVDHLMSSASEALAATRYFDCEQLSLEAMGLARTAGDYERLARITLPLQEARRQKRQVASENKKIVRLSTMEALEPLLSGLKTIVPGCYLLEPLLVGADGRDLRDKANAMGVPIIVVVREPETKLGAWPIVMVGPITVRTRVKPPAKEKPDLAWMLAAGESLGDAALETVDSGLDAVVRVERLADLLATVVDHEKLHQALEEACRDASREVAELQGKPKSRKSARVEENDDESSEED